MDPKTKNYYNTNFKEIDQLHSSIQPHRLYELSQIYFKPNSKTLDLGCGTGRDSNWLQKNNFDVSGCDFSEELIKLAKFKYNGINFFVDSLPSLKSIKSNSYESIFSSAVLQHIPRELFNDAIRNILRIVHPGGTIILSFRGTNSPSKRENEKLYEDYTIVEVAELLVSHGAKILFEEKTFDSKRNLEWKTIVCEKVK